MISPEKQKKCQLALDRAKLHLMQAPDSVFFSTLCFSLKHKFDESIPTACTDGRTIRYNPDFFLDTDVNGQVFLLLHETMHCAYVHMVRIKAAGMEKQKANIAADHVINLQLIERGFKPPTKCHANPDYKGMSMEEIYKILPDEPDSPFMDDLMEPGSGGEDGTGKSKQNSEAQAKLVKQLEADMQDILIRAAVQSKLSNDKPGTIPGDIQIFLDNLLSPKLPWNVILRKFLQSFNKNDYSWTRPNRRFSPKHYLPSLHSESLIDLTIAVDTSASVSDEEFKQFVSEAHHILKVMKPSKMTFIQFDTELKSVEELKDVRDLLQLEFHGRGGTSVHPVMDWAKEHQPKLLVVFTDGYFDVPQEKPPHQTLWVIHNNTSWECPFGKTIHYELNT